MKARIMGAALAVLGAASIGLLGAGCQSAGQKAALLPASLAGRESVTLVVQGLSCPLCAHNLDKTLLRLPGVKSAVVDLSNGTVNVGLDPAAAPPTAQALEKAVADSGFTLVAIR